MLKNYKKDILLYFTNEEIRKIANNSLKELNDIANELGINIPSGGNIINAIRKLKEKL